MAQTAPRRQRILMLLSNNCAPDWRVQKEARSLGEAGYDVTILAWDREAKLPQVEQGDGYVIRRIDKPRVGSRAGGIRSVFRKARVALTYWREAVREARALGFDAVHCHDLPTLPAGVWLAAGRRTPLVFDAHEMYWLMVKSSSAPAVVALLRWSEVLLLKRVSRLVTVSHYLAGYFRLHHPRVTIVGNWYDPRPLDAAARKEVRMSIGLADADFCLACIGTLGPERLQGLLVAYAAKYPDTHLLIAGRGTRDEELVDAAKKLPNLHFLGWRSDPERLYAAADALFYGLAAGDEYSKVSSPNTMFLAIAMTIPLVTTPMGDAGLIAAEHGAGVLLEPATVESLRSAIVTLRDPERRRRVSQALLGLQSEYSWHRAAGALIETYAELFSDLPARGEGRGRARA